MLKKILTAFIYVIVIALVSAIIIATFMLLDRPIYEPLIVIGAITSIWLLFVGVRALIVRYRAKKQVERILQEEATDPLSVSGETDKSLLKEMRNNWRSAIKALRASQLKLRGNPLYVLPWFMVFGKPSSGKSTSLRSAKLLTPKIDLPERADGSTLNLDWWLYEEAIVIDTAGRYAVPDNEKRDRVEWKSFLKTLARHKQKEPLSGLVLIISAERLLENNDNDLLEEGRHIRASLTDLMKNLEAKPPVYLMVTKCDLIPGFKDWCEYLPVESLRQSMGYLNEDEGGTLDETIDTALNSILGRMKELRLLMLERSHNAGDSLLTLPVEMEKVRSGLHTFANTALKENVYQETPRFRGLFFSSGVLEFSADTNTQGNSLGGFLHHFYTRILPSDRGMTDNLAAAVRIRNAIRAFAISISGAVTFASIMVLTSLYSNDFDVLDKIKTSFGPIKVNQELVNTEMSQLKRLRELIISLDAAQGKWVVPWTGTTQRNDKIQDLVDVYNERFRSKILNRLDEPLKKKVMSLAGGETSVIAGGVVRRINLIKVRLSEDATATLDQQPDISGEYVVMMEQSMTEEAASDFNDLYKSYLTWSQSPIELMEERAKLQSALLVLLERNQGDYEWIIDWAESQGGEPVRLTDFWGGNEAFNQDEPHIPVAYTLDGREIILEFMEELRLASGDNASLVKIMSDFDEFYERKYVRSWVEFAKNFDHGTKMLSGRKEWLNAVERMSTDGNPYFSLLERMHTELEPISHDDDFLARDMVDYFSEVKSFVSSDDGSDGKSNSSKLAMKALSKAGKVGKIAAKVGRKGLKAKKKMGGKSPEQLESMIENAAKTYEQYRSSLVAIAFNADSRPNSMATTAALFLKPDEMGAGEGSVAEAEKSVLGFQMLMGKPNAESQLFWDLYTGPIRVSREYMREETACHLQDLWEKNVLAELEGVATNKISNALIGEGGLVWGYIDNHAQAFLHKRQLRGYQTANANGMTIPWTEEFMRFANNGSVGKNLVNGEYTVRIGSLPTGVNQTAQTSPYSTILDVRCAGGVQTLANYNYNSTKEFKWSLEKCGDVSLSISIGQITLRKEYKGEKGFPEFLRAFRDGHRVFVVANEFPEYVQQLHNVNVRAIDVNYEINGQEPLVEILNTAPLSAPAKVAACWQ